METGAFVSPAVRIATRQDLLEQVFAHCDHRDGDMLAKCARVSHAFFKPAVKVLWGDLPNYTPIVYVLWKSYKKERGKVTWISPIEDEQWARLELYGALVKHIEELREDHDGELGGAGFVALALRAKGRPIFGHLKRVSNVELRHMRTYEPLLFLSAPLREVAFSLPVRNEDDYPCKDCRDLGMVHKFDYTMGPLLQVLHMQSPHLTTLSVNFHALFPEVKSEDVQRISLFRHLRHLHVQLDGMSLSSLLMTCAKLRKLTSLSLRMSDIFEFPEAKKPKKSKLRTLTDFKLRGHPAYAVAVLEHALESALESVVVFGPADEEDFYECLDSITKHFSSSLTTLGVTLYGGRRTMRFADIGDRLHLLPKLQYCFLEFVEDLRYSNPKKIRMSLTDDDIAKAALAWPRLRKFILSCAQDDQDVAPLAESVQAFAAHCPELQTLVLPSMDASRLPAGVDAKVERCELPGLTTSDREYYDVIGSFPRSKTIHP
ncbi:hypothetical protein K466DRAFT_591361 [Polyporus arcularius HHB13444]|uniref:F-box domain-containing protein n=1 Tax=Polyporus arcularius HHB13444 TaxID=1314778 RepID=A0A5C3NV91_9APHY|nr:hypothetical protein K466DRAFT_591361 [Polyporus arcularius HHB13444]